MYTSYMLLWAAVGERAFLLADTGQVRARRGSRRHRAREIGDST
jgi:hypothetical protein